MNAKSRTGGFRILPGSGTLLTPMPRLPRATCLLAVALAVCAGGVGGIGGCAKRQPAQAIAAAPAFSQDDVLTPVVRGGANGLEVLWFVCRDQNDALASALAPFVYQPVDVDPATRDTLRLNGVRLVRVPLADFSTVRDTLRPVGPTERSWLGWSLHWAEAFRARSLVDNAAVRLDGDAVVLGGASTRLLARAWGAHTIDGERVRVELVTQIMSPLAALATPFDPLGSAEPGATADYELARGEVIEQLAFEAQLEPGYAYFLVPAPPEEDWAALAERAPDASDEGSAPPAPGFEFADAPQSDAPETASAAGVAGMAAFFGPPAPAPPTLGEAILTSWDPFDAVREPEHRAPLLKAVIALVPRCETPARLLPPAR